MAPLLARYEPKIDICLEQGYKLVVRVLYKLTSWQGWFIVLHVAMPLCLLYCMVGHVRKLVWFYNTGLPVCGVAWTLCRGAQSGVLLTAH